MTRKEAIERFAKVSDSAINSPDSCDVISLYESIEIIKEIYNDFEEREIFLATKDLCSDKCKHYLSDNGNYPLEPCGECSRFYADMWEPK